MSMRAPEFEASLYDAKLYPQIWRLVLGFILIVLIWVSSLALIAIGVFVVVGPFGYYPFLQGLAAPSTPAQVLVTLSTFVGLFFGAILAAAALHFRDPASLFGEFPDWLRGFLTALAVMTPVYGGLLALSFWLDAPVPNMDPWVWLKFLPLGLVLLFVQIAAEELVFRGYLQQQLAARFRSRLIWMWLPTILFALLHWSPQAGANWPLVLLSALTFGLVAADLTEQSGNLGAAMGIHLGNNFAGIFLVGSQGAMTGLALYVTPETMDATGVQSIGMAISIIVLIVVWALTRRLIDR